MNGIMRKRDLKGIRFERLVALREHPVRKNGSICWVCKCDCGNKTIVTSTKLRIGHTRSCGCLSKEITSKMRRTHGGSRTDLYVMWSAMKRRCQKPNVKSYKDYGGRGISVCDEWEDYAVFRKWANENGYEKGLSIDRIDNDGNYHPDNCRWVTQKENNENTRLNVWVDGMLLRDMLQSVADELGMKHSQITSRYYHLKKSGLMPTKKHLINYKETLESIKRP